MIMSYETMSAVASKENTKVCSCLVVNGALKSIENKYNTPTTARTVKIKTEITRIYDWILTYFDLLFYTD